LAYPADILVHYLTCGVMKDGLMRASGGVQEVIAQLLESQVSLKTSATIERVEETENGVLVSDGAQQHYFDRVVVATQPHHACELLQRDDLQRERCQWLAEIPVTESRMQLHTDQSLLPESRLPLAPVTYYLTGNERRPEATVDLT